MDNIQHTVFRKNLIDFVQLSGKTQAEIAKDINVSPQTFNTWMRGIAMPRAGKLQRLADYFGILKSDLIEDKKTLRRVKNINDLVDKINKLDDIDKARIDERIDVMLQSDKYKGDDL